MTSDNSRHKESEEKENENVGEEVGACTVSNIVKTGEMVSHGQNARREITGDILDRETRRLQKTRKITAMMG